MTTRLWRTKLFARSPLPQFQERDLERAPWCYLLWGTPAVLAFATSVAYGKYVLSLPEAGIFWTVSVAWIGIGCFINGRFCGRVHCQIDGILFPALCVVGILKVATLISISWSLFWISFFVILAASFVIESFLGRYSRDMAN